MTISEIIKTGDRTARVVSHLLSPVGVAILALLTLDQQQPGNGWLLICLTLYGLLPLGVLLVLHLCRSPERSEDVYDPGPGHRQTLLRYGVAMYAGSAAILWGAAAPGVYLWAGSSFLLGAVVVSLVDRIWKISIHTTGAGGAVFLIGTSSSALWPLVLGLPVLVGWARLVRGAHSPAQVVAGAGVGAGIAWLCRGLVL